MLEMSSLNYMDLCRLCLVKEQVSVPIFDGEGDVRQIFIKITTCLPVKVSKEDRLPKKICSNCVYRVENSFEFWNTTVGAEKQLLEWLEESSNERKMAPSTVSSNADNETVMETEQLILKEETLENDQSEILKNTSRVGARLTEEGAEAGAGGGSEEEEEEVDDSEDGEEAAGNDSEESAEEDVEEPANKEEVESEEEEEDEPYEELEPTTFVNVSLACDEAGPSGLQQQTEGSEQKQQQQSRMKAESSVAATAVSGSEEPSTSAATPSTSGTRNVVHITLPSATAGLIWPPLVLPPWQTKLLSLNRVPGKQAGNLLFPQAYLQSIINSMETNACVPLPLPVIPLSKNVPAVTEHVSPTEDDGHESIDRQTTFSHVTEVETVTNVHSESTVTMPHVLHDYEVCDERMYGLQRKNEIHLAGSKPVEKYVTSTNASEQMSGKDNIVKSKVSILEQELLKDRINSFRRSISCKIKSLPLEVVHQQHFSPKFPSEVEHDTVEQPLDLSRSCSDIPRTTTLLVNKQHNALCCDDCRIQFGTKEELDDHCRIEHTVICNVCSKQCKSQRHLGSHMRWHAERLYKCKICGEGFPTPAERVSHSETHRQKFSCAYCAFVTYYQKKLELHKRKEHGAISSLLKCSVCSKPFYTATGLRSHEITKHAAGPLKCPDCGKLFALKRNLDFHQKVHESPLDYLIKHAPQYFKCKQCGKVFLLEKDCENHVKTHSLPLAKSTEPCEIIDCEENSVEENVKCSNPDILFFETEIGDFPCELCDKMFISKKGLKMHLIDHLNALSCRHCKRFFKSYKILNLHVNRCSKIKKVCTKVLDKSNGKSETLLSSLDSQTCAEKYIGRDNQQTEQAVGGTGLVADSVCDFTCKKVVNGEKIKKKLNQNGDERENTQCSETQELEGNANSTIGEIEVEVIEDESHDKQRELHPLHEEMETECIETEVSQCLGSNVSTVVPTDSEVTECGGLSAAPALCVSRLGKMPYHCSVCNRGFITRAMRNIHAKQHST